MTARPTQHLSAEETPSPPGQLLAQLATPRGAAPENAILGPINGRYDLAERIAKGGMGIVYRAHDRLLNRTVAVKVMRGRYVDARICSAASWPRLGSTAGCNTPASFRSTRSERSRTAARSSP